MLDLSDDDGRANVNANSVCPDVSDEIYEGLITQGSISQQPLTPFLIRFFPCFELVPGSYCETPDLDQKVIFYENTVKFSFDASNREVPIKRKYSYNVGFRMNR